jgi:hypothetical protein
MFGLPRLPMAPTLPLDRQAWPPHRGQVGPGFGLGLQATGHRHEPPFRDARKIATMRLEFGVRRGNPGCNSLDGG